MTLAENLSPDPGAPIVEFALDYARRGWPVFPCKPKNKAPFFEGGFYAATTDEKTIRKWWGYWSKAMIGVPMGPASGVWAIDPDPPKKPGEPDGREVLARIAAENGPLPATHTEVTPRGGQHIVFKWDPDRPVTNSPGRLSKTNIDVRGEGGYIVVAPSTCIGDGSPKNVAGQYRVAEPLDFFHFAIAPNWLYDLVLKPELAPKPAPKHTASKESKDGQFWRKVNDVAFQNLGSWVPALFPNAEYQQGTGAYRISSQDLGRDLDEDLSIHPDGAKDWGVHDIGDRRGGSRSAIDIVMEHGEAADAKAAALWLCERCNVDPVSLGWSAKAAKAQSVIGETKEIDNGTVTQDGVAQVFARRFEDHLRYCHHTGAWFEWTGTYWRKDETALAFQFCRELAREFTDDAKTEELKEVRKISFAGGVEKFAKSDRAMAVTSEIWDCDPFLLGTPDGTVDLRTGKLREPAPTDGITRITAVSPADAADCPRWLQFLDETFGDADDGALIRFIQQWNGYCLAGDISEHALVFGFGNGGNGKGVWLNTTAGIMGDYATTAAMETFTASKFDRHPTELAMLRGARMVTASETEEGRSWAESRIKQLTGGDPITARFMQKDFFTFQPTFKLTIIGNHKPLLQNVDDAARRRFNLIPFNRVPACVDKQLGEKLKVEWPGILRWMIDGCLDWQKNGLTRPESVIRATESYFEVQDSMAQWLAQECDAEPGNAFKSDPIGVLFASWTEFANKSSEKPGSIKSFSMEMVKRGFERGIVGHGKAVFLKGVQLLPKADDEDDQKRPRHWWNKDD
jgi:putative DNA primase/helicase